MWDEYDLERNGLVHECRSEKYKIMVNFLVYLKSEKKKNLIRTTWSAVSGDERGRGSGCGHPRK